MNIVDYAVLGIILISILYGFYRGFITSLLSVIAVFAAMFAAYAIGPVLSDAICKSDTVVNTLAYYTDASSRLGDLEISRLPVSGLDASAIAQIIRQANLPAPFDKLLETNLVQRAFETLGNTSVSDYVNRTVITGILSVLCYVVVFFAAYLALSVVIRLIGYVFRFPSLKVFDTLMGGAFGLLRGIFMVYIIFALVPVALTVIPVNGVAEYIDSSTLGHLLYNSNIVSTIFKGGL